MKQIFTLLVLFLLFSCKKEAKNTDEIQTEIATNSAQWSNFFLNGNVKSTASYTTAVNDKEQTSPRKFENQFEKDFALTFDKNGKLIHKETYNEDGSIAEEIEYDGKDKILSSKQHISPTETITTKYTWEGNKNTIITRRHSNGTLLDKQVFQYDKGLLIKKLKFNTKENLIDRTEYNYNTENKVSEEIYFKNKPVIQARLAIEYNENGNKLNEVYFDSNYKKLWKTSFTYDGNRLINSTTFNADGNVEYEVNNIYNEVGLLLSKEVMEPLNYVSSKEVFEYDANNNNTLYQFFENGQLKNTKLFAFDENDYMISETLYDNNKNILYSKETEYMYDEKSNWIKKKITINSDKTFFVSRKIEYFN